MLFTIPPFILGLILLCYIVKAPMAHAVPAVGVQHDQYRRQANLPVKKAGLGWPNGERADMSQYSSDKVGWYYSWSAWPVPNAPFEFVPMFRRYENVAEFNAQVNPGTIASRGVRHILGLNEPQEPSQGIIEPPAAAEMWKTVLEPLKQSSPSLRLGSPAVSNAPSGKVWLQQWFAACGGGCNVDFVTVHWYGLNASDFIAHVSDFYYTFQRPIWVTEWAAHNFGDPALGQFSQEQVNEFLKYTQSWLDSTEFVERYAWFGAMLDIGNVNPANRLMTPEGAITELGKQYISVQQPPVPTTTVIAATTTSTGLSSILPVTTTSPGGNGTVFSTTRSGSVTKSATATGRGVVIIEPNAATRASISWTGSLIFMVLILTLI